MKLPGAHSRATRANVGRRLCPPRRPRRAFRSAAILRGLAVVLVGGLALITGRPRAGAAERNYPERSIDLLVPWSAGGGTDRLARFLADALQRRLGQPVIVINRTGGAGVVGHMAGALAKPDGYTLTLATFELGTMKAMGISELTSADFTPVAQINADAAALIVRQDARWHTLGDLLDTIRREPGRVKMSGTATGGAWDLARAGLLLKAGLAPTNVIWAPAQGSAPALVELLGGHIDVVSCSVPEATAQLEGGQARALAVLSSARLPQYPDFPTAREQGIDYEAVGWRGLMLPKGAPAAVVSTLNAMLVEITRSEDFAAFMRKNGFTPEVRLAADFSAYLAAQETKWREVIRGADYEGLGRSMGDPGPRAMPWALAAALVLATGAEWRRCRRAAAGARATPAPAQASPGTGPTARPPIPAAVLAGLVAYVGILPWAGFSLATLIFATALMWRLGTRWWLAGLVAALLVAGVHLLFVNLFKVPLP